MSKTKPSIVYRASQGARYSDADAAKIGAAMEAIKQRSGRKTVKPTELVEYARPARSPIHHLYVWDADEAIRRVNEHLAREHMNHLVIVVLKGDEEHETKAVHNVVCVGGSGDEEPDRGYVLLFDVANDPVLRQQVIDGALRELELWKARYEEYKELLPLIAAMGRGRKKMRA